MKLPFTCVALVSPRSGPAWGLAGTRRAQNKVGCLGLTRLVALLLFLGSSRLTALDSNPSSSKPAKLANSGYELAVAIRDGQVQAQLKDKLLNLELAGGPYLYRAKRADASEVCTGLENAQLTVSGSKLVIRGTLAGLALEHSFELPGDRPWLEEKIVLYNQTDSRVALTNFEAGFIRQVANKRGEVSVELAQDRWVAVPMRARATDPKGYVNDFSVQDLIAKPGYEPWVNKDQQYLQVPSRHHYSEGWAWTHGGVTVGIFVFNQQNMLLSVVSPEKGSTGTALRFGGACMISGEPAALSRIGVTSHLWPC